MAQAPTSGLVFNFKEQKRNKYLYLNTPHKIQHQAWIRSFNSFKWLASFFL